MKHSQPTRIVAAILIAGSAMFGLAPFASADDKADNQAKVSQADKPTAKPGVNPSVKAPTKLAPPKINLPKPPAAFPRRDQKLPVMPELPSTAPKWLKNFRSDVNKFIKDHPAPGVRWVDKDGNPV